MAFSTCWLLKVLWNLLVLAALFTVLLRAAYGQDNGFAQVVKLPALRVNGEQALAHIQGLEVVGNRYYVTARRDDVKPRQPLLICFDSSGTNSRVWHIAVMAEAGQTVALDHPGGMQSDGKRLWIPIAESKPRSRTIIRAFSIASLDRGAPLKAEMEFAFNDHIGALAVSSDRGLLLGANWDTQVIYVWDLKGNLQRTLTGPEVGMRGLGFAGIGSGVAVQDWKLIEGKLFASGLWKTRSSEAPTSRSRFMIFSKFLETDFQERTTALPLYEGIELSREAMAVSAGFVYFLPEDLGPTNRLFRVALDGLLKRSKRNYLRSADPGQ